jgi:hypothetical protein
MIKRFASLIARKIETQTSLLQKKANTYEVKCTIDDEQVDCNDFKESPYIGIPAPVETPTDSWFTDVPPETIRTEKQITHEEMLEEAQRREEANREEETKESENIHQMMYEMASQNWNTVAESQGGSENFQENTSGWSSGTGMGQFK